MKLRLPAPGRQVRVTSLSKAVGIPANTVSNAVLTSKYSRENHPWALTICTELHISIIVSGLSLVPLVTYQP